MPFSLSMSIVLALSLVDAKILKSSKPAVSLDTSLKANTFAVVGLSGASGQQMFLGTPTKVYIVDKTENNPATVMGANGITHPAWATEYDLPSNTFRTLDIETNSFCAGGSVMGNGSWLNVGGNNAVTTLGVSVANVNITEGGGAYGDFSGGRTIRVLTPCSDGGCSWTEDVDGMPINRWYPSLETLPTGEMLIMGGELYGGFVNSVNQHQSVPTYEYWPTRGAPVTSPFLVATQPANLYPLTWQLPNGKIFMQANWQTTLLNLTTGVETSLPNITHAQKTYPASGATAMLPLTIANNYTPTILMCGGMKPERDDWDNLLWAVITTPTSSSCVSINPQAAAPTWVDEDSLPENRGMGNFIILPDERLFLANGVGMGSAGYGYDSWALNQSYATDPVTRPAYYNHSAPAGSRFDTNLPSSSVNRLYHSSATLIPDGSVMIAGSAPSADVITEQNNATYVYKTEYRTEIFYPSYYDAPRPVPAGLPTSLSYGGAYFDITLPASSLTGGSLNKIKVNVIRTGFSTHGMNMGQRYLELNSTHTGNNDGSATLHVSPIPPNAALLVPGPAMIFVVVNGIPSIGQFVMIGSGTLGVQSLAAVAPLPASSGSNLVSSTSNGTAASTGAGTSSSGSSSSGSTSSTPAKSSGGKIGASLALMGGLMGGLMMI